MGRKGVRLFAEPSHHHLLLVDLMLLPFCTELPVSQTRGGVSKGTCCLPVSRESPDISNILKVGMSWQVFQSALCNEAVSADNDGPSGVRD